MEMRLGHKGTQKRTIRNDETTGLKLQMKAQMTKDYWVTKYGIKSRQKLDKAQREQSKYNN